ncbi:hypothetical protein HHK36_026783 [Tetracentron sinense]|uniref:Uncharacterized protein n=1 Tax=Tetracentron sinense TaxID=13715 RepID=A0A834YLD1_TETSI|nr:hypothetical protein HHK36_026783 [Tetracentron sinense]
MAASTAMQSILVNPMTRVINRSRSHLVLPSIFAPRQQKSYSMRVRCKAEEPQQEEITPVTTPQPPPPPKPTPPRTPKVSTSFSDVLAFSGPAPERINGRLAMVGFVAAMGVELWKGDDVFAQLANGGIPWFVGTSIVLSVASLIPLFKGVNVQSKYSGGVMSSDAELWNGRFAMLGLVALAFTEYVIGGAIV